MPLFEMRERRVRAGSRGRSRRRPRPRSAVRARQQRLGVQRRRIDDLGEDRHVVAGEVEPARPSRPRNSGRSASSSGPRTNGTPNACDSRAGSMPAATGQDDAIGRDRPLQAAQQDRLGHQRRDLHADIRHLPREARSPHAVEHAPQPRLRQVPGQEQHALFHLSRAPRVARPASHPARASVSDHRACHRTRRAAACCRGRCGADRRAPCRTGASVSSSGALSQANTITGTRHLPACANTLVASVSEMPSTHFATVFEVAGASTSV